MALSWDPKIGPMQIINLLVLSGGIIGGGFSFYYKMNATSAKVDELSASLKEKGGEFSQKLTSIDNAIDSVKTDVNVIRVEVVKISADSENMQRQIDDIKEDGRSRSP